MSAGPTPSDGAEGETTVEVDGQNEDGPEVEFRYARSVTLVEPERVQARVSVVSCQRR